MKTMVSGLPGKMAREMAELISSQDIRQFELLSWALTGSEIREAFIDIGGRPVYLIKPDQLGEKVDSLISYEGETFYAVDFTHPDAINGNVEFYCKRKIPFVLGTTGGNRDRLAEIVAQSDICAVIAPNMASQIVAFQAMMEYAAKNFPGAFEGFNLFISESHQEGKADTSGTAKAIAKCFEGLGIPFHFENKEQFQMIRKPARQSILGVPAQYLGGHGWHDYSLATEDGTMQFKFVHNVNGRKPYAVGTLKALAFLEKKTKAGEKGKVFSMIDVLKG